MAVTNRLQNEIEHSRAIHPHAEEVWGWASPAGQLRATRRGELLARYGELAPGKTALEIGCGTGLFTEKLAASGATLTAIDLSEDLLQKARQRKIRNCTILAADAHHLAFADNTFDAVCGSSILHHLDLEQALREAYRVLRPNGRLAFAEPNMLNPQIFVQKNIPWIKRWLGDSPDERALIRWSTQELLRRIGFREIEVFPVDFLHPATPRLLIPYVQSLGTVLEKLPGTREIAEALSLSVKTVETHRHTIKRKLALETNAQLVQYALRWHGSHAGW